MSYVYQCERTKCVSNFNGKCNLASGIEINKDGVCTSFEAKQSESKGVVFENDDPMSHVLPMSTMPELWNDQFFVKVIKEIV